MTGRVARASRWTVVVGLVVAVGATIAAMNWYGIWSSLAELDAESGEGRTSLLTVESQASFQRWILVALVSLVVTVAAMASQWLPRANAANVAPRERIGATDR